MEFRHTATLTPLITKNGWNYRVDCSCGRQVLTSDYLAALGVAFDLEADTYIPLAHRTAPDFAATTA